MNAKLTYLFLLLSIAGFSFTEMKSQDYGFFSSYNLNREETDIRQIGLSPDTLRAVLSGTNSGFSIGLFYNFKLANKTSLRFLLSYTRNNPVLTNDILCIIPTNVMDTTGLVSNILSTDLSSVEITPEIRINLIDNIVLMGGFSVGYRFSDSYNISQSIRTPNIIYSNGSNNRTLNYSSKNGYLQSSLQLGLGYKIYIDELKKYSLTPEVKLAYGFSGLEQGFNVDITSIKFGISFAVNPEIKYPIKSEPPKIIIEEKTETKIEDKKTTVHIAKVDSLPRIDLDIRVKENGIEKHADNILFKQTISTNTLPVLNYIFFEKNSHSIPDRYILLNHEERNNFSYDKLINRTTLEKYHHILNIIGYRMTHNPDAVITLTGCNSGEDESNDLELSADRCSSVKDYLIKNWEIDTARITCINRNLPFNYSGLGDSLSLEENRRVEIKSNHPEILNLLTTNDTVFTSERILRIEISNKDNIKGSWELLISNNNKLIKVISGTNEAPEYFDWTPANYEISNINEVHPLAITFTIIDSSSNIVKAEGQILTKFEKSVFSNFSSSENMQIENYSLILFDFNSSALTPKHHDIIKYLSTLLKPDANIFFEGYTDITGDSTYNINLSTERALNTYKALSALKIKFSGTFLGLGYNGIYDNRTPEGRFYSRTVIIRVVNTKK